MTTTTRGSDGQLTPLLERALAYPAPYVVERLVNDRVVGSAAAGERLFTEIKRYLVLNVLHPEVVVGMYSARVDEAWHAFLLYTREYADFCDRYLGRFLGHTPRNAPSADGGPGGPVEHGPVRAHLSFAEFAATYEQAFDEPLPDVWFDARGVTADQRLFSDRSGSLTVGTDASTVDLLDESGEPLLTANVVCGPALDFVARTGAFYVRELPGGLTVHEQVRLVEALVAARVLRLAP